MRRRKKARSIINFKSLRQHSIRLFYRSEMLPVNMARKQIPALPSNQEQLWTYLGSPTPWKSPECTLTPSHCSALPLVSAKVCAPPDSWVGSFLPPLHVFFCNLGSSFRALSPPLNQREIFGRNLEQFGSKDWAFCRLLLPKFRFAPVIVKWYKMFASYTWILIKHFFNNTTWNTCVLAYTKENYCNRMK